jgi:hypothetical protein
MDLVLGGQNHTIILSTLCRHFLIVSLKEREKSWMEREKSCCNPGVSWPDYTAQGLFRKVLLVAQASSLWRPLGGRAGWRARRHAPPAFHSLWVGQQPMMNGLEKFLTVEALAKLLLDHNCHSDRSEESCILKQLRSFASLRMTEELILQKAR